MTSVWQPIETAPRDGTEVLLHGPVPSDPRRVTAGFWIVPGPAIIGDCGGVCRCPEYSDEVEPPHWCTMHGGDPAGWMSNDGGFTEEYPPTHWQPLPAPPSSGEV